MTWYANEIIINATPTALAIIKNKPEIYPFTYLVDRLDEHHWFSPKIKHGLPKEGLIFIRPICNPDTHASEWYEEESLNWNRLSSSASVQLPPENRQILNTHLDEKSMPPEAFRQYLLDLSKEVNETVIYYGCFMWGGDIEFEYCLIYENEEEQLLIKSQQLENTEDQNDILQTGLKKLELTLPSVYFAPHTRSFRGETICWPKQNKLPNHLNFRHLLVFKRKFK